MQNVHFTPPELARLFSVNVSTIKRWVDKGFLEADVTAGGHRRVSQQQLARFVKRYPRYAGNSYVLRRFEAAPQNDSEAWEQYYRTLHGNDDLAAARIIEEQYLRNASVPEILDDVVAPALRNIGAEWRKGRISIYEEHRMSFLVRAHLFRMAQLIPEPRLQRRKVAVLACVLGEQHEIALQMLALVLKQRGWTTHILGINIPSFEVVKAAQQLRPTLLGLSKVFTKEGSLDYLNVIAAYARRHRIQLAYGGSGWNQLLRERTWRGARTIQYIDSLRQFDAFLAKNRRA